MITRPVIKKGGLHDQDAYGCHVDRACRAVPASRARGSKLREGRGGLVVPFSGDMFDERSAAEDAAVRAPVRWGPVRRLIRGAWRMLTRWGR
jgi:hypothetical protein